MYEMYEDRLRQSKAVQRANRYSPYCDLVYYPSSRTPGLRLAMRVLKPAQPSDIVVNTHGWHMSMPEFVAMGEPAPEVDCLTLQVDMRGRAYSDGKPDCNGWELYDVIDAVTYAREHYGEWLSDDAAVCFEGGSGGGGNAYAIAGKFPDFFSAITALYGITDYEKWYRNDTIGEFRDEMDVWIGTTPDQNPAAYQARSGLRLIENLQTPLLMIHGERDARCPVEQARVYLDRAGALHKMDLIQYCELPGVGGRGHLENATPEQLALIAGLCKRHRLAHRSPVQIPERGRMVVAGYLFTKHFSVVLDSLDQMAEIHHDRSREEFQLISPVACRAVVEITATQNTKVIRAVREG